MSDKELQKELESLRSEVAALSKARAAEQRAEKKVAEPAPNTPDASQPTAAAITQAAAIDIDDPDAVQTQIDTLLERCRGRGREMDRVE